MLMQLLVAIAAIAVIPILVGTLAWNGRWYARNAGYWPTTVEKYEECARYLTDSKAATTAAAVERTRRKMMGMR